MTEYRVTWSIDVEADSPQGAATRARDIQQDPTTIAHVFEVASHDDSRTWTVDLDYDPRRAIQGKSRLHRRERKHDDVFPK
jgi:hypothetical protein